MHAVSRSLEDLIEECLSGGRATRAWDEFERRTKPGIARVAHRVAGRWGNVSPDAVQDFTQETFLKLCANDFAVLRQIRGKPEPVVTAFIKVVTANLIYDHFRAECSEKRRPEGGLVAADALERGPGDDGAAEALSRKVLIEQIDDLLRAKLSGSGVARDRQIFWLKYRHGMTAKAIAAIPAIGLTEKGVEARLYRTLILLRKELQDPAGKSAGKSSI
jgi:RNA polymerase sigma-70 factor, ECF subfamily